MQAWKCTCRPTFFFSLFLSAFISSSYWWTVTLCGQSLKPRSGVLAPNGSISTPHLLLVWWETWEPCLDWAWLSTPRCSFRAAKGRTAPKAYLNSRAWLRLSHFCSCMTSLKCQPTVRFCSTCCRFVKVLRYLSVQLLSFLTASTCWWGTGRGSWIRLMLSDLLHIVS